MKKILYVIDGNLHSGAEIVLDRVLKNNNLIQPYILLLYKNGNIFDKYQKEYGKNRVFSAGLKMYCCKVNRLFPFIEAYRIKVKLLKIIKDENIDLLYANNTNESIIIGHLLKKISIPSLAHVHDMKETIKDPIRKYYAQKLLPKYKKVVTVSEKTKTSWFPLEMEVIYNGLEDKYFLNTRKKNKNVKIKIGFIGQLSLRKGIDIYLEIIKKLKNEKIFEFHIIYNSYEKKMLKNLINYEREFKIKVYKNLNSKEILEKYDELDILIVPSRHDPLPTVIMEATAKNTIVFSSNNGGMSEMLSSDFIVKDNSVEEYYKKIQNYLQWDSELKKKYLNKNKEYTYKKFNLKKTMNQIKMLLEKI